MRISVIGFLEKRRFASQKVTWLTGTRRIKITSLAFLFLLLLAGSAALLHAETYVFTLKWGTQDSGDGQFNPSGGVAVDGSVNVYEVDAQNYRVQKFETLTLTPTPTPTPPTTFNYITSSASSGITIAPSGVVSVGSGSSQTFTMTPSNGNSIDSINVDGNTLPACNYQFSQTTPINSNDKNEKIAIVNGQRYILTGTWTTPGRATHSNINVYTVDSNWQNSTLVSTAPSQNYAADFYVKTLPAFPNSIMIVGRTDSSNTNGSFVGAYNVNNNTWSWATQTNVQYITNIYNPVSNTIYLQVAIAAPIAFYETTAANLFSPSTWIAVNDPSWAIEASTKEFRITYFDGRVYAAQLSVERPNDYQWVFGYYTVASSTWSSSPLMVSTDNTSCTGNGYLFGYVWADTNFVTLTVPFSNSTWGLYYSTDGTTFNCVSCISSVISFSSNVITEQHCWATDFDNTGKYLIVSNEADNSSNGYMAIMNLNGDVLAQGGSFSCHDTELTNLIDDNYIVQGGEIAQPVNGINYYANVKLVSFSQTSSSTYTFTFENVQTSHTIVAASTPTPTPPNLFSTSSPISSSINYGLISVIAFVGIFLISTIVVVNRQKNKREREKLNTKAEQVEREERERAEQNENNKNKPKKKEPKKNARKLGMKPKGNLRNKI